MGITIAPADEDHNLATLPPSPTDTPGPEASRHRSFRALHTPTETPARELATCANSQACWALNYSKRSAAIFVTSPSPPAGRHKSQRARSHPSALAEKQSSPYGDFLLHNVGTGDGIVTPCWKHTEEDLPDHWRNLSIPEYNNAAINPHRTALGRPPALASHARRRFCNALDAILRHGGEAAKVTKNSES